MNLTLEDIWTQFSTRLRFFIRGRVTDEASAEDILQNVFVKIQHRLGTLRGVDKLEAWVYQIARNEWHSFKAGRRHFWPDKTLVLQMV